MAESLDEALEQSWLTVTVMITEEAIPSTECATVRKPRVLVVDDDPQHHKLLELLADRLGITVHHARSCAEATAAVGSFSFDLILMDCRMPDLDGCWCTERIRALSEKTKGIPIVAVTGNATPGNRERCLQSGMDDFLLKPFTLEELQEKLNLWAAMKDD
jgi:CheY-like chemotaxis protein